MKYYGTDIEMRLGDKVLYKHLFWGKSKGIVAYIPGISPPHSNIGPNQWVLKLDDGKCVFILFTPQLEFTHPRVMFLERGIEEAAITPSDPIY